jgi:hypothetical protein
VKASSRELLRGVTVGEETIFIVNFCPVHIKLAVKSSHDCPNNY